MEPEKKKTVVPMAAPVEEPKPNMFQNWTQNGQGNWNKLNQEANAGAQQWATDTMQKANITDPTAPAQPVTPPYNPGVQVAQPTQKQPVVQQQTKPYTGGPDNPEKAMDYLSAMYTSPQREEELRKASIQQQRIMAVANALRHIGNIYYTSKGATPQQFNDPVSEERTRYLKEKAIRDQNNYRYMTYQQAKAAQEQKAKQWEQQFKLNQANAAAQAAYRQEQARIAAANAASQDAYRRGNLARQEAADKARNDYNERKLKQQISHQNRMAGIAGMKAQNDKRRTEAYVEKMRNGGSGSRGGSSYDFATPNGNITMPKNFNQTQRDQVLARFDKYIDMSDMQRQMRALGLNTQDPAQVRNFQFAKMLQEHQDVADYVSEKFGGKQTFTSNPLARPESGTPQPMFQTPWGGASFAGANPYDEYLLNQEADSDDDYNDDYEQYLIQ